MKHFNKIINLILVVLVALVLVGCKEKEPEGPIPLDTRYTDELKLSVSYAGKEFIADGIGLVTLNRPVDGDTITVFSGGQPITIRFLGIDTPESTGRVEAWGKAASEFVRNILIDAHSIVLEAEGSRIDSTGRRYLAWVWYRSDANSDFRLLNLELIEQAYTRFMVIENSKYFEYLHAANEKAMLSLERVWGGIDPNFNYSKEIIETSILYLMNNPEEFQSGTKFLLTVQLVRTSGNNMFLRDAYEVSYDDDGEIITGKGGVYAFYGYSAPYYRVYKIGDIFTLQAQFEYQGQFGTQLTGLEKASRVIENVEPELVELDAEDMTGGASLAPYDGHVVKVTNLTFVSYRERVTDRGETYFVVEMKNSNNQVFDVYFGNGLITKWDVPNLFETGAVYNIIGGISYYEYANGKYQLAVGDAPRYVADVLNEEDIPRLYDVEKVE